MNPPNQPQAALGGEARRPVRRLRVRALAAVAGCVLGAAALGGCSSNPTTPAESTPHPLQSPRQTANLSLQTALDAAVALGVLHGDDMETVPGDLAPFAPYVTWINAERASTGLGVASVASTPDSVVIAMLAPGGVCEFGLNIVPPEGAAMAVFHVSTAGTWFATTNGGACEGGHAPTQGWSQSPPASTS